MPERTSITIIKTGASTMLIGAPRYKGRQWGIREGGALDAESAKQANELVGNQPYTPLLEFSLIGPTIEFNGASCTIALTGADFRATLDGKNIPPYSSINVHDGSTLKLRSPATGSRAYLAIAGTWGLPKWMDSESAIEPLITPEAYIVPDKRIDIESRLHPIEYKGKPTVISSSISIEFVPGPEYDMLSAQQRSVLESLSLTVSPASNRQGLRFVEGSHELRHNLSIISSGVFPGVIQLTPDGHLIVLLADAQTSGGYPRVGVISRRHLALLGQARGGVQVNLTMVGPRALS